jgi:proline dehydrogenase
MEKPFTPDFTNTEVAFAYRTDDALKRARLIFGLLHYPWLVRWGIRIAPWALRIGLPVEGLIRKTFFAHFCGGESLQQAAQTAAHLGDYGVGVILDYGVEAAAGEDSYEKAVDEFIEAITFAAARPAIPFISLKVTGFARFSLLEKLDRGEALDVAENEEWLRVQDRIRRICDCASKKDIGVLIDAEESWIQRPVDALAGQMMQTFNVGQRVVVYNTYQLYRQDKLDDLKQSFAQARAQGYWLGAKLVRGAYMDKERKRARQIGYPSPIQPDRAATDRDYNEAIRFCMDHVDTIAFFIATHNAASCRLGAELIQRRGLAWDHPHICFAQLYGMSDPLTFNLAAAGFRTAKYLPYGPVKEVMPYLIRRAEENTAIAGQMGREYRLICRELKRRHRN